MRRFASSDRAAKTTNATPQNQNNKKPSSLRRKGMALLAGIGILGTSATALSAQDTRANIATLADAQQAATTPSETIIRVRAPNCVNITESDLARVTAIKPLFDRLAAQPITGTPIVERLRDPAHRFQICLDASLPANGVMAAYMGSQNRLFVPVLNPDFESVAHEAYHAYQDTMGGLVHLDAPLNPRDMAMSLLLSEASAVGYTLMLMREVGYSDPAAYTTFISNPRNSFGMGPRFEAAYNASYNANITMPEDARRRTALEAGGKAVVEALVTGAERGWSGPYSVNAVRAAQNGDFAVNTNTNSYRNIRDEQFRRAGYVGENINIIPNRFLGANADVPITQAVEATGVEIARVPASDFRPRRNH